MEKKLDTSILINATVESVWAILIDFENYPNWNPFIKSIKGEINAGNKIVVKLEPPESGGMTFKPTILTYKKNKEFSWLGHLLFSGLFDGEHKFELIDNQNGTTTFKQTEKFNGILVPLLKKQLDNNTKKGFELMNSKLKELAEKK